jgi:hypothetical protein
MKLKPVVASLVVLGVMSPVFADPGKAVSYQQSIIDQNSIVNTVCTEKWFNRVTLGGRGSVIGIYGDTNLPGSFVKTLGGSSDIYVNDAILLVGADLSSWAKFNFNLGYTGAPSFARMYADSSKIEHSAYYTSHNVYVDEAYVNFADFSKLPLYLKVGKSYLPFGEYNDPYVPWQIESPAQMLSQANGPAAILGIASDFGLYASVFAFKGMSSPYDAAKANQIASSKIRNWGAKMGYKGNLGVFESPNTNYNINVSYLRNVWDTDFFMPDYTSSTSASLPPRDEVGAIAAHIDLAYQQFSMYADWVGVVKNLADSYYWYSSTGYYKDSYVKNSKFWGANVNAAYAFETLNHDSSFGAGVQFSGNGQWFADNNITFGSSAASDAGTYKYVIPKWRILAEYKINLCKYTDLGLVYSHGKSYENVAPVVGTSVTNGVSENVGYARLAVKF